MQDFKCLMLDIDSQHCGGSKCGACEQGMIFLVKKFVDYFGTVPKCNAYGPCNAPFGNLVVDIGLATLNFYEAFSFSFSFCKIWMEELRACISSSCCTKRLPN